MTEPLPGIPRLDRQPVIVALAGPNGAGKSTFYHAHLRASGLRFLNSDLFARELQVDAYEAARIVGALRHELVGLRESFIFETVFSDPVGEKLTFLKGAAESGYTVVLCFIGVSRPALSEERVAMRVSQGGHDVPTQKLVARFPRTMRNLHSAIPELPYVLIFDNSDLLAPFRRVAEFENGRATFLKRPVPRWSRPLL